jgi:hypothetical protein
MAVGRKAKYLTISPNDTMTGNVVKSDVTKTLVHSIQDFCNDGVHHTTRIQLNTFSRPITGDANLAFGQKLFTFPSRIIQPLGGWMRFDMACAAGLQTTAGEVALGATVGSGAVAVLTGTAGFNDILQAETLSTVGDGLSVTQTLLSGGGASAAISPVNGVSSAIDAYFNVASAWNQTASESVTFSNAIVVVRWADLGTYA